MGRHGRLVGLLAALLMLVPLGPAAVHAASTVTVSTCDEAHLRAAIAAAGAGGTVTFACSGTITLAATLTIAQDLTIDGSGRAVTLSGGGSVEVMSVNSGVRLTLNHLTIANGSAANNPFEGGGILNNGTLNMSNSTVTRNNAENGSGGGIYNNGGMLLVTNSTFTDNAAIEGIGGGIYNNGGTLSVVNSTFSGNSAYLGGGIISSGTLNVSNSTFSGNSGIGFMPFGGGIDNSGTASVTNSTFSGNSANGGGGIYNSGTASVTSSIFNGNGAADNGGGGIYNNGGTLLVSKSTFSGNGFNGTISGGGIENVTSSSGSGGTLSVADSTFTGNSSILGGGGIFSSGMLSVTNSTFSGNSATAPEDDGTGIGGKGGGIDNNVGTLRVTNSTFSGNSAAFTGGGIAVDYGGTATMANTIVASSPVGGNCAIGGSGGTIGDGGGNVDDGTTCGFSAANRSLANTNPRLLPLANNGGPTQTMALPPGSPAIGAGLAATCLSTGLIGINNLDQRGMPRHAGTRGNCDSGAYDTGGATVPLSCALTAVLAGPPKQLQVTVRDTGSGLATIQVLQATNSTVAVPTFSRGTTSPVVVTATKIDQTLASQVALQATDVAGNVTRCDPVLTSIIRDEHQPTIVVARGIDRSEGVLHIANGDPGLRHLVVLVDGVKIQERDLAPGEQRTVDISAALQPGSANTVVVIARGKQRGEATLVIADS